MFEDKTWHKFLPDANLDVHQGNLEEFFNFMFERQEIWYKRFKLKQVAPWTDDPYLRDYKFTNVYRELDNSSQYLIKNVYLVEEDIKQVIFSIFVHRIFNKAYTFEMLRKYGREGLYTNAGYPRYDDWDLSEFLNDLKLLENTGVRVLNQEAYKINTYIWGGEPRWQAYTKYIIGCLQESLDFLVKVITNEKKEIALTIIDKLRKIKGIGLFLAHEYYQDFCDLNTYFKHNTVQFTKNDFTNVGPGASVGIRLIFPSLNEKNQLEGISWLRELAPKYLNKLGFKYLLWNPVKGVYDTFHYSVDTDKNHINLHTVEMTLCEYQKYKKMQWGAGKQRGKFKPSN